MDIFFISQYFHPEIGAAANRGFELCRYFVRAGHKVSVLTTFPSYPKGKLFDSYAVQDLYEEDIAGIHIYRVPSFISKYASVKTRAKTYLSFIFNAMKTYGKIEKADIVIGTSGPVFVMIPAYFYAKKWNIPCVMEVRDIQSKALKATRFNKGALFQNIISLIENSFLKKADLIIPVTHRYRDEIITSLKIDEKRFLVIENGMDFNKGLEPLLSEECLQIHKKIKQKKAEGLTVISYFGNLGVSQRISDLCSEFLKSSSNGQLFLVFGNGPEEGLIQTLAKKNVNLIYHESVPEEEIRTFYGLSDFCIVKLIDHPDFAATVPSKLYRIIGNAAIPIFIGPEGEASDIISKIDGNLCFRDDTMSKIFPLCNSISEEKRNFLKKQFFQFARTNFDRESQATLYLGALAGCLKGSKENI